MSTISWRHGVLLSVLPLCSCAQPETRPLPVETGTQRIVLTTRGEYSSSAQVATYVENLSRVPVRDVLAMGQLGVYRMTLVCPDEAACRAAMARIAADRSFALAVEVDRRQQIPVKPSRDSSR